MDIENDSTLTGYLPDKRRLEGVPIVDLDVHVHDPLVYSLPIVSSLGAPGWNG